MGSNQKNDTPSAGAGFFRAAAGCFNSSSVWKHTRSGAKFLVSHEACVGWACFSLGDASGLEALRLARQEAQDSSTTQRGISLNIGLLSVQRVF